MIRFRHKGNFNNTEKLLENAKKINYRRILDKYGREGVAVLSSVTPIDSGLTSMSWTYEIKEYSGGIEVIWKNTNIVNGVPVAILLQYGHGTRNGGYVQGRDYINPALQPIFDRLSEEIRREVASL